MTTINTFIAVLFLLLLLLLQLSVTVPLATPLSTTPTLQTFSNFLPSYLPPLLSSYNYTILTPIQALSFPSTLPPTPTPTSYLLQSPTGTGKTLTYLIPLIARLTPTRQSTQSIILVPTRDLTIQVTWECRKLTKGSGVSIMGLTEGIGNHRSAGWLRADPPHVIVGTPSLVLQMLEGESVICEQLKTSLQCVVLDEIDELVTSYDKELRAVMGKLLHSKLGNRLTMFTSATVASRGYFLKNVVKSGWCNGAKVVKVVREKGGEEFVVPEALIHEYVMAKETASKLSYLRNELKRDYLFDPVARSGAVIVFVGDKTDLPAIAASIASDFKALYFNEEIKAVEKSVWWKDVKVVVSWIGEEMELKPRQSAVEVWKGEIGRMGKRVEEYGGQGDQESSEINDEVDELFRASTLRIIVAKTESFGRGIDCLDCHTVYNYDLPGSASEYVHRGGRAGRMGRRGRVVSVVGGEKELFVVEKLGRQVGKVITKKL